MGPRKQGSMALGRARLASAEHRQAPLASAKAPVTALQPDMGHAGRGDENK